MPQPRPDAAGIVPESAQFWHITIFHYSKYSVNDTTSQEYFEVEEILCEKFSIDDIKHSSSS